VQFPFVKVFPPQMLSSSSEGAIVQAVPIAFALVDVSNTLNTFYYDNSRIVKNHLLENKSIDYR